MEDYFAITSSADNNLPNLPPFDRQAIVACCANHIKPFDIVEDRLYLGI